MSRGVLVVEDDAEIRELLAELLAAAGYRVATAKNGLEALEWLKGEERRPCMVVLDLMMPIMDGWELRAKMLEDPALADIKVAVVSGAADVHAASLQAVKVFAKPLKWKALLETVRSCCAA